MVRRSIYILKAGGTGTPFITHLLYAVSGHSCKARTAFLQTLYGTLTPPIPAGKSFTFRVTSCPPATSAVARIMASRILIFTCLRTVAGCRPIHPLPITSRTANPHHDRARPAHLARRTQRLSFRPHRSAAPTARSMASGLRRLHLVALT